MRTDIASIIRGAAGKAAALAVAATEPWTLFAGPDENSIDFSRPVASGVGPGTVSIPGAASGWACFAFVPETDSGTGPLFLAERHLPMVGGYNFRDLGGFSGADGKRVVWGKLIRADGLNALTDGDLAYLASMPLATVVDFRTGEEAARSPDRIPDSVKAVLHMPIAPGHLTPGSGRKFEEYASPDEFMLDMYRDLALDKNIAGTYRSFFARIQAEKDLPLLFHCSAGKDRTGVAAALILLALGVSRETVLVDYEASNAYLGDKYAEIIRKRPSLQGLLTVKRIFLEEALALVETEYGSVTAYLENVLDVDVKAMRRRFLV